MPTEATLWAAQEATATAALDFAISFLDCRQGSAKDQVIDAVAKARLLKIIRAVSLVETRHGTTGPNQPTRDPLQSGNPGDAWWRELVGLSGLGDRFIRGPNYPSGNLWANEVQSKAEATAGFPASAAFSKLGVPNNGHDDSGFKPFHSYVWGVIYLIYKINTRAGDPAYACGNLSRARLLNGAAGYNGHGDLQYPAKLESALAEIGDFSPPLLGASSDVGDWTDTAEQRADLRSLASDIFAAAELPNKPLAGVSFQFDGAGRVSSADLRYHAPSSLSGAARALATTGLTIAQMDLADYAKSAAVELQKAHPGVIFSSGRRDRAGQASAMANHIFSDRDWIRKTYAQSQERDTLQKWVDDNPQAVTKNDIAAGILGILNTWTDAQSVKLSRHLAGLAFDVSPSSGLDVKAAIQKLPHLVKFLDREGDDIVWHAEFDLK